MSEGPEKDTPAAAAGQNNPAPPAAPAAAAAVPVAAAAAPVAPAAAPAASATPWDPAPRHPLLITVIIVVALAALAAILYAWELPPFGGAAESTDNAYVRGRTAVISPQVSGYVVAVLVRDYEQVAAGQVLVRIDDRTYKARLEQARANLAAQTAALANSSQAHAARSAGLVSQQANIGGAQAQLLRAQADMARIDDLVRDGSVSVRERDQALAALAAARAQLRQADAAADIARQDIRSVDVGRDGLSAQVEAARAQLQLAEIDLEHTVIRAPEAGRLGEVSVRLGQYVSNGSQTMAVVPAERWIIANYKEAQLEHIRPGQKASFVADALGGVRFTGSVERISPAAGSEFSVLRADNATGNFVKVPQRLGVRIRIDPGQELAERLLPGMSVELRIDTKGAK